MKRESIASKEIAESTELKKELEMKLNQYTTLGRSGLKVSPLCLGAMTFGEDWGWGSSEETAKAIFDAYVDKGGNFIDTADGYTNGKSEEFVGKFVTQRKLRDQMIIATKFTFCAQPGNPNAGGNGRKNIYRALEGSLKRLNTDYIDLYWLHAWDMFTPVEEVLLTLNDLVKEGKIRYFGLSDVPAWYLAKMQTIAELKAMHKLIALQVEYSLLERTIENEHVSACKELGVGICPWSPLASGMLTGKYKRDKLESGNGRMSKMKDTGNPSFEKLFTERNWKIVDKIVAMSKEIGRTPAQIALNWVVSSPGITSTIIGATKLPQLEDNLGALNFVISKEHREELDEISGLEPAHPYVFFSVPMQAMINGNAKVRGWS